VAASSLSSVYMSHMLRPSKVSSSFEIGKVLTVGLGT
jgi:hypothetical protein